MAKQQVMSIAGGPGFFFNPLSRHPHIKGKEGRGGEWKSKMSSTIHITLLFLILVTVVSSYKWRGGKKKYISASVTQEVAA